MTAYESRTIRLLKEKFADAIDQRKEILATNADTEMLRRHQGYIEGMRDAAKLADDVQADMNEGG